ncbi:malto-oligosyltrehalose trehalohydrolase [Aerophototrophica crusticola]
MARRGSAARRLPQGAEVQPGGGVHFRIWAPDRSRVALRLEYGAELPLNPEGDGFFAALVPEAKPGSRYKYCLDGGDYLYPDPMSRFQPDGPHGPSQVVDPASFQWTDHGWEGVRREGMVLYEMHVGTFTPEGTWDAAIGRLEELRDLGVTCLEVMPVADFAGSFGWGYDGVNLFAPTRLYGSPDDFRRFVDRAHGLGLGVILDVVYNHFGPDGNYLSQFAKSYFSDRYENEWGDALNFDGPDSGPVRDYMVSNARYWVEEFHLDGLRLDATQQIFDASTPHIIAEVAAAVREAGGERGTFIVGENEPQELRQVLPRDQGGHGLDALWNDDLHHTAIVALTGRREAYYKDYRGSPQEFVSAAKYGFLYTGQHYVWQGKRRGSNIFGQPQAAMVSFLQNHDQVANSARGWRIDRLTGPGQLRAMTAYMLLIPATPMLFQGQEFRASTPFHYFADHSGDLAKAVRRGRREFLNQFQSIAHSEVKEELCDPADRQTFEACKLDHGERETNAEWLALHHDLLALRREDPVFRRQDASVLDGSVLAPECFVLRWFGPEGDRVLLVNLGPDLHLSPAPEPLLGAPTRAGWCHCWSSEDPRYGGLGYSPVEQEDGWHIPGRAAVVLVPAEGQGA